MSEFYFSTYQEWREGLTVKCRQPLTAEYAEGRLNALRNDRDKTTREFIKVYGEDYRQQVIRWFERARNEATA